ncbi:MAG: hypothetical protein A2156_09815 [Deltaproteobacteria bacterium RBG_16_48_10]|nr:MAG: hypothetical protein A2156_09815 [Deltaproteobacteria bacterium RBG_16_48_10]
MKVPASENPPCPPLSKEGKRGSPPFVEGDSEGFQNRAYCDFDGALAREKTQGSKKTNLTSIE